MSFEKYWAKECQKYNEPALTNAQMRDIALKAWNASIAAASDRLNISRSEMLLNAGEMNAQEIRTAKAVLNGRVSEVKRLMV